MLSETVHSGAPAPGFLRQTYHASVASLMGEDAMDSGRPVDWPSSLADV
ncbi:hypothetical protein [Allosphingosinicella deserti]|nr:hypothetical protein [Sphingomonas deserti]